MNTITIEDVDYIRVRSERNYIEYGLHERSATAIQDVKDLLSHIDDLEQDIQFLQDEHDLSRNYDEY
jgi:hypothetical protein